MKNIITKLKLPAKIFGLLVSFLLLVISLSLPWSYFRGPELILNHSPQSPYILTNIKLVDIEQRQIIDGQSLLIDGGKIEDIVDSKNIKDPTKPIIDGQGKYLIPGLVDSHVHVFDPQDLGLYLSHGITSVRNMAGLPAHLRWKQAQQIGEFFGARLVTTSPALNAGDKMGPFHVKVNSPEHARELVQKYKQLGFDAIKVYSGLNLLALTAIMNEAEKIGLRVSGHPSSKVDFADILSLPYQSLEHIEELYQIGLNYSDDVQEIDALTTAVAKSDRTIVTTLHAYHNIYLASAEHAEFKKRINWDYLTSFTAFVGNKQLGDYWPSPEEGGRANNDWEKLKLRSMELITQQLFSKGASMAIGTDTGPSLTMPGLSMHSELALLEELNIPRAQILLAATKNSAELLNIPSLTGTIEKGAIADMVLVSHNPFESFETLKEPFAVISNGQYLNRQQLDSLRQQGKDHHSLYTLMGWLLAGVM